MMEKVISDTEKAVSELKDRISKINEEKDKLDKQLILAEKIHQEHLKTLDVTDLAGYLYELVRVQGRHIKYSGDAIKDTEARLNKSEIDLDSQLAAYNNFSTTDYGIADAINVIQEVKGKVSQAISEDFQSELKKPNQASTNQEIKFDAVESPILKAVEPELKTVNFDELSTDNNSPLTLSSDDNSTTLDSLSSLFNGDNSNPFEDNTIAFPEVKPPVTSSVSLSENKEDAMDNTITFSDALGDLRRMTSGDESKEQMNTASTNTGRQKVVNVVDAQDLFQGDSQEKETSRTLGRAA